MARENPVESAYEMVIICEIDGDIKYLRIDVQEDPTSELSSTITSHPIVNGDIIADHMYNDPSSKTVSGTFGIMGSHKTEYDGEGGRLYNIQKIFNRIKREAIPCRLVVMSNTTDKKLRFVEMENMVLNNIRWTEKQSSLDFTFTFTEVLTADVKEIEYEVDVTDPNLPAITDVSTLDFTDTLLDWDQIDKIVIAQLQESGLISKEFLNSALQYALSFEVGALIGAAAGTATFLVGMHILGGFAAAAGASGPIGWGVLLVLAAVGALAGGIIAIIKKVKQQRAASKYKTQAFKLYQDDRKNQAEVERFANYLGTIHQNLEVLEQVMHVYGIGSNENQECMLSIDNNYYIFTFEKNNVTNNWSMKVKDVNLDKLVDERAELGGLANIGECTDNNALFRTSGSGFYVYLINLKLEEAKANGRTQQWIDENITNDLTTYAIFVSEVSMSNFNQKLYDIVENAMRL